MRNWMIKHWYYNWDSKVFGAKFGGVHLRVVNSIIVLFCLAGLLNMWIDGFGIGQALLFLPSILLFIPATRKWITGGYTYEELDWEQRLQYLRKALTREDGVDMVEFQNLLERFEAKYYGKEKFVEAWRFFFPILVIVATCIIYWYTGQADADYDRYSRFF